MGAVQRGIVEYIGAISDQHGVPDQSLIAQKPVTDFFFGNGVTAFLHPRLDAQNGKIRVAARWPKCSNAKQSALTNSTPAVKALTAVS